MGSQGGEDPWDPQGGELMGSHGWALRTHGPLGHMDPWGPGALGPMGPLGPLASGDPWALGALGPLGTWAPYVGSTLVL